MSQKNFSNYGNGKIKMNGNLAKKVKRQQNWQKYYTSSHVLNKEVIYLKIQRIINSLMKYFLM